MNDPDFLKRIHSFDQASTGFNTMATMLGTYFELLMNSGFTREEAFSLVLSYQKILLNHSFGDVSQKNNNLQNDSQDEE